MLICRHWFNVYKEHLSIRNNLPTLAVTYVSVALSAVTYQLWEYMLVNRVFVYHVICCDTWQLFPVAVLTQSLADYQARVQAFLERERESCKHYGTGTNRKLELC